MVHGGSRIIDAAATIVTSGISTPIKGTSVRERRVTLAVTSRAVALIDPDAVGALRWAAAAPAAAGEAETEAALAASRAAW